MHEYARFAGTELGVKSHIRGNEPYRVYDILLTTIIFGLLGLYRVSPNPVSRGREAGPKPAPSRPTLFILTVDEWEQELILCLSIPVSLATACRHSPNFLKDFIFAADALGVALQNQFDLFALPSG